MRVSYQRGITSGVLLVLLLAGAASARAHIAIDYDAKTGTLVVTGDDEANRIDVRAQDNGVLLVNGRQVMVNRMPLNVADTTTVQLEGGQGNDVLIGGRLPSVSMSGGGGADRLLWQDTEGVVIVAEGGDMGGSDDGTDEYVGGTDVAGLYGFRTGDLLETAPVVEVSLEDDLALVSGGAGPVYAWTLQNARVTSYSVSGASGGGGGGPSRGLGLSSLQSDGDPQLYLVSRASHENAEASAGVFVVRAKGDEPAVDVVLVDVPDLEGAYDDDDDLDLFLVNAPGGDNAIDVDTDGDADVLRCAGSLSER